MGDLFFIIKAIIGTFLVVVFLQVKVGEGTIEDYTMDWIHNSPIVQPLEEAAHGGVIVIRDGWNKITAGLNTKFSQSVDKKNVPGMRSLGVSLERSKSYLKRQAQKATDKIRQEVEEQTNQLQTEKLPSAKLDTPDFQATPLVPGQEDDQDWVE